MRVGFLPMIWEKVDPYLRPLYDSLYDLFHFEKIQRMIEIGDIEIAPLAFMRGRTLKNSFAILMRHKMQLIHKLNVSY